MNIVIEHSCSKKLKSSLPDEVEYADDVDFININEQRRKRTCRSNSP